MLNEQHAGATKTYIGGLGVADGTSGSIGTYRYFAHDHLGSTRGAYNESVAKQAKFDYDPFGGAFTAQGGADLTRRFTGHTFEPLTGMYVTPFRTYNPTSGRWLQPDPLGMINGPNMYSYVGGNPLNFTDPLGLSQFGAEVAYGETAGLRPRQLPRPVGATSWGIDNPKTWDMWSWVSLEAARRAIADVSERNNKVQNEDKSKSTNPIERRVWNHCKLAADAADGWDLPKGANNYFIRQAEIGRQKPARWEEAGGRILISYGPFVNVAGGGDVPKGDKTYIDVWTGVP